LGQRSRKRGQRSKPRASASSGSSAARPAVPAPTPTDTPTAAVEPQPSRSQRRDAEVRAALSPIRPGERPGAILVSTAVAAALGLANLILFAVGLKIDGKHPAAGGIVIFSLLMISCAVGLWRLWYGAVLGFMALLAIIATIFALLLIESSNLLGLVVSVLVVGSSGYLFFKLVRVLSRIQMPRYPGR
jgi:hypothetical protein